MISRRMYLIGSGAVIAGALLPSQSWAQDTFATAIAAIEQQAGGRLGVAVLDTGTGRTWGYKANERFAMCSTFKMMLVAAVLWRADAMKVSMNEELHVPAQPLLGNSPSTTPHAGRTMPLGEVCRAAITVSDNTAANMLLERIGGPEGFTTFIRATGDEQTRLDRTETSLNEAKPGDPRDTTTPLAMLGSMRRTLLGDTLTPESRDRLLGWMIETKTGLDCLRAGMPADWKIGDKTGSDGVMTRNDIAIVWPTGKPPILITAYLTECQGTDAKRNAVLAAVGKLIAASL